MRSRLPAPALLTLLLSLLALFLVAAPSSAVEDGVDVEALAEQLAEDPVLVDPASAVEPDADAVRAAVEDLPVPTYVVVLPQAAVDLEDSGIDGVLLRVVDALDDPRAVVVVVTDGAETQAGEGGASGVQASRLLDEIVQARGDQEFDGRTLTGALLEFAAAVEGDSDEGAERGVTSSSRRAVGVAGLVGVAVLGAGMLFARSQRRARQQAPLTDIDTDAAGGEAHGTW